MDHKVDEEICGKYRQLKESESVKNTHMWLGSHEIETHSVHIIRGGKFVMTNLRYPFSIVQVGMENVANMLDRRNEFPEVDTFRISFNPENGEMSMFNNGPSMPVAKARDANGNEIWLPEMLCTKFLSGSNHDKDEPHKRISLGVHGIGLKATTSMSVRMHIECADVTRGLYYSQLVENCNQLVREPVIETLGRKTPVELRKGGTRFTFLLDYAHYKDLPQDIFKTINSVFEAKAYQVAAYSGAKVYYNGAKIPVKNAKQLADMYFDNKPAYFELTHPEWGLSIALGPPGADGKGARISIINGGAIESGIHFDYVLDHIAADARFKVERMLKDKVKWRKNLVTQNLSVLIVGSLPDLIFDAQIKNNLKMKNHKVYMAQYEWPKTYMTKVWPIVEQELGVQYIVNSKSKKTKRNRTIILTDKYLPAYKLKTPDSDLLAFEGDSAKSSATTAMADPKIPFSRKTKGIFLLGGCPINVYKHVTERKFGDSIHAEPDSVLQNNVQWTDFMTAMGLEYGRSYKTEKDLATLNYRHYTNVVDKDPHGMGKIGPIMIANIYYFWPELLSVPDFLGYMDTPLIRAYPTDKKKKVKEFGSQDEFDQWAHSFPDGKVTGWRVKWYKGLATHTDRECTHMFGRYDKLRIAYTDEQKRASISIAAYFGRDTDVRKEMLLAAPAPIPFKANRKTVDITVMLNYFTREEQQYNIACKINHMIDNGIMSHRRLLWGIIDYIRCRKNADIKVYQLGAYIAEKFGYHHGDASLYGAMVWLTQDYVGARNIPFCLPISQFGTRFAQDDAGAPRYIDTRGNPIVNLLYPKEDTELLEMMVEDGSQTIPKHLVPVLPMSIMETNHLPGTGWAIKKLARHPDDVIANIDNLLNGKLMEKMRPWTPNWNGRIIEINGAEWAIGSCTYNAKTREVEVTELPYQTDNQYYINGNPKRRKSLESRGKPWRDQCLLNRHLIDHRTIKDNSTKLQISITFKLHVGAISEIEQNYGNEHVSALEEYLYLTSHFGALLNFVDDNGCVHSFPTYESAMIPWFMERWQMYPKRFARQRILLNLTILMIESKLRYIDIHKELKLAEREEKEQDDILERNSFVRFNTARLKSPKVPNDQIERVVLVDGASYNYLLLNHRQMSKSAIQALKDELVQCQKQLDALRAPDIVKRTWMSEINAVYDEVKRAHRLGTWVSDGDYQFE
jgi:DNA topoisomerase-2